MITFEVGPEAKTFQLHADIIAKQSAPLGALINGNMKEAHDRHVV